MQTPTEWTLLAFSLALFLLLGLWRSRALRAEAEARRLRGMVRGLADRVAQQSELLSRRAER